MNWPAWLVEETPDFENEKDVPDFLVLIIYDSRKNAGLAKAAFDLLPQSFPELFNFHYDLMPSDHCQCRIDPLPRWASKIADLFVIAASNPDASAAIQAWLSHCVRGPASPTENAPLIDLAASGQSNSLHAALHRALYPLKGNLAFYVPTASPTKGLPPPALRSSVLPSRKNS